MACAAAPAVAIRNTPTDVLLRADFPQGNAQTVVGVVQFYGVNGVTKVHVDITGLPKNSGMFHYHIHDKPVGADKTCHGVGLHFNPYNAAANCDAIRNDALCAIGDLSGKHGLINTTCFEVFYQDPYLSLNPASPQYIGNKALVIHLENGEKLACATIKPSREPEDLLMLNAETEAEEVKKYGELGDLILLPVPTINATAVASEILEEAAPIVIETPGKHLSPVEDEHIEEGPIYGESVEKEVLEADTETETDADVETDAENVDEVEVEVPDNELDDLVFDEIEKHPNYFSANSTNSTGNGTTLTGTDEEESRASTVGVGIFMSIFAACVVALAC